MLTLHLYNFRWKVQRKFTLDFMRKFGMSKFNPSATNKIENKIKTCINEFFIGKNIFLSRCIDLCSSKIKVILGKFLHKLLHCIFLYLVAHLLWRFLCNTIGKCHLRPSTYMTFWYKAFEEKSIQNTLCKKVAKSL